MFQVKRHKTKNDYTYYAEHSFSVIDWIMIENITDKREDEIYNISDEQKIRLCFNVLPG